MEGLKFRNTLRYIINLRIAWGFLSEGEGKCRDEGREGRGQARLWLISVALTPVPCQAHRILNNACVSAFLPW